MTTERSIPTLPLGNRERLTMGVLLLLALGVLALSLGPLPALALVAAAAVGWMLLRFPDLGTSIALFLFYSNVVAVSIKYHGVPRILGASVALLLVIPLIHYVVVRREPIVLPRAFPWMVLLTVVNIVGALLSKSPEKSLGSAMTFLLEGFVLYFILANVVRTKERLRLCLLVLLAAGVVMSAVPLYQQVTGDYENDYGGMGVVSGGKGFRTGEDSLDGDVRQKRLTGSIGEQNRYAQILLVLVPIGAFGFRGVSSQRLRRLAVAGAIVTAAGATVAFSRGGAVGFAAMLMVGFGMRYLGRRELIALVLAGFVLLAAAPQYVARLFTLDAALQVIVEGKGAAGQIDDGAINGRATAMGAAFLVFLDYPIIGVGPGMFRYYSAEYGERIGLRQLEGARQAHSLIPDIAAEHGIVGLLCYFFVIGLTLRELHQVRMRWLKDDPELAHLATGLLLAIVSYLCVGMFIHRAYIRYFWIVMGLAASVRTIAVNQDANET